MTNSVHRDYQGPDWPLGWIQVVTPGTPVEIMSLVETTQPEPNEPETLSSGGGGEYTFRAQQILFQAYKPGTHGMVPNTGNIYLVRDGVGSGTGNRDDQGATVVVIQPGQTFSLGSAALNRNVFSPFRYSVDADNGGDGVLVTMIIQ
jgi:hypothetical protein